MALELPLWSVVPFVVLLLAIAVLPLAAPHFWESNRNKLIVALLCGVPVAVYIGVQAAARQIPFDHAHPMAVALHDYVAFMLLLFALFVISGGIHVKGTLAGTPSVNAAILTIGAVLASFIGTTGASMVLLRPLLRANAVRKRKTHIVIFFIFIVSNCGGLLTPLGDPPLFLGFLKGVPFLWTMQLVKPWLVVNGILLVLFHFLDSHHFHREDVLAPRHHPDMVVPRPPTPLQIEGWNNVLLLAGVVVTLYSSATNDWPAGFQEGALLLLALASITFTPKSIHRENQFSYRPILEVAALFLGIFLAMVPALHLLNHRSAELPLASARSFFWASGALSSFLDNAPTYLTFTSIAAGLKGVAAEGDYLAKFLALGGNAPHLLAAISCGSVMMGANTYIGNGPNFMVKAIAEHHHVKMPSFFGYMAWSVVVLLPVFTLVTVMFF
jgi:Na+/H+ antiporter NhaD/arsenite permease-like protein